MSFSVVSVGWKTGMELGYLGDRFGRPFFGERPPPWWCTENPEPNADTWAAADESGEQVVGLYRQAWAHSDTTVAELTLDAVGHVPWWPEERREVTLHHVLARVISDTQRHAGHADIVRQLIDGSVGYLRGKDNLAAGDRAWWQRHRSRLERLAREADV
ncbi:DUF664 domain-containing protein [Streptomyces sp. L2]|uniref:mycothiol transferase n=1 Tax=Streptomyces sp. L2 TaxID=2162665 RepID=UPI001010EA20|nr:DUF664 domain-containing protein [Streptomyces sp. L2]